MEAVSKILSKLNSARKGLNFRTIIKEKNMNKHIKNGAVVNFNIGFLSGLIGLVAGLLFLTNSSLKPARSLRPGRFLRGDRQQRDGKSFLQTYKVLKTL